MDPRATTPVDRDKIATLQEKVHALEQCLVARDQLIAELRAREHQLSALLALSSDWMWEINTQAVYTFVSPQVRDLLGYEPDELLGKTPFDLMLPEEAQRVAALFGPIAAAHQPFKGLEYISLHKNGTPVIVETDGVPIFDCAGTFCGFRGVDRDITARKQAEEALRIKDSAVESSINAIAFADLEGQLTYVNQAFLKLWGYDHEVEVLGRLATAFWSIEAQAGGVVTALHNEGGWLGEMVARKKDGTLFDVQLAASMVTDTAGNPIGMMGAFIDITARKRAEASLRASEDRYRQLFEMESDAIFLIDNTTGQILEANAAAATLYGYTREELLEKKHTDLSAEPDKTRQVTREEHPLVPVRWHRKRDGTIFPVEITGRHFDWHGRRVHIAAIRDITERKLAEEALRARTQRMSQALRAAHAGAWEWDMRTNQAIWSDENYLVLGLDPGSVEANNDAWLSTVHPADRQEAEALSAQAIKQGSDLNIEFRVVWPDGSIHWINDVGKIMYDETGQPVGMYGIQIDITARKQMEENLRQSETRYRNIFETAAVSLWEEDLSAVIATIDYLKATGVTDFRRYVEAHPDFVLQTMQMIRIVDVNQQSLKLFGAGCKDELLNSLSHVLLPESLPAFAEQLIALAEGQRYFETETVNQTLHGERRNVLLRSSLPDPVSPLNHVLVSIVDITERKRVEAEREALIRELETKNAELERFTYTVSHDLKSPLITIKGYLGYVERDARTGNTARLQADLERIANAAARMQHLLDDLLELSRIGRLVNPAEVVSLCELVREAQAMVAGQLNRRGVTVAVAPDLPVVYGDRLRLREVFENLLDNAARFMGDQPHPRVEIGIRHDGPNLVIYVCDNGIGIEPPYHTKVFGLFEQLDPQGEGTGIGLALVKRIIEVHGGQIWVESEGRGKGSTFCFFLPEPPMTGYTNGGADHAR